MEFVTTTTTIQENEFKRFPFLIEYQMIKLPYSKKTTTKKQKNIKIQSEFAIQRILDFQSVKYETNLTYPHRYTMHTIFRNLE